MRNYLDLMVKCRDEGIDIFNSRTNITCRTLIGAQVEFDLSSGLFPAVTTKKLAFKGVKGELLGFFRGYTSAADFRALGCNVWNQNANETPAWLDNPFRKGEDDLGPIYGKQWTEWDNYYEVSGEDEDTTTHLEEYGYILAARKIDPFLANKDVLIYKKTINQLEVALRTIITNPSDRRIIVTGWNPGDIDKVALPACHMDYRFIPANGILNVVMTIRSWDLFLGAPFNIASTALFLEIMCRLSGLTAGKVIIQAANAHLYSNHFEALEEQLTRQLHVPPTLLLSDNIKPITDLSEIEGVFTRINPEDISLVNYSSGDTIKAPMAA